MECRPPLPICAEGGGGKQLLGSKGHCLAQKVRPTLPGRAASLASTSPPDPYGERRGEGVGREGVKRGEGRGGLVEIAKVGLMGHFSHSSPTWLGETQEETKPPAPAQSSPPFPQITHHRCTPPPRPAGPVMRTATRPHPPPHVFITDPPTTDVQAACSSKIHQTLTYAQDTTPSLHHNMVHRWARTHTLYHRTHTCAHTLHVH